ncbi:MAG TPA: c-type cytochrome biogenesis protein CcsB, partial [Microbacteriaceae bacterium]|nr:c-type cytochrome biogenesis protein CcsB [Microbacteriaceae bacterium]
MTETLSYYSDLAVWSAIAIYALAFLLFTLDLSRRSVLVTRAQDERAAREAAAAQAEAQAGRTTVLVDTAAPGSLPTDSGPRYLRAAIALTWVGWIIHLAAALMRGIAASRVPWANMYEFALTATAIMIGVFLLVQFWQDLRYLGSFITGFVTLALGLAALNVYVPISPLPAALASGVAPIWLVIHIVVATLGTGFFA